MRRLVRRCSDRSTKPSRGELPHVRGKKERGGGSGEPTHLRWREGRDEIGGNILPEGNHDVSWKEEGEYM